MLRTRFVSMSLCMNASSDLGHAIACCSDRHGHGRVTSGCAVVQIPAPHRGGASSIQESNAPPTHGEGRP